jgi:hypothetical protein
VHGVMANGRYYDAQLNELGAKTKRRPLWFSGR